MNAIDERPKDALLPDLLSYEAWDPRSKVIWLKDGSATQTFSVTPKNVGGVVEEDLSILRSGLTTVLNQLPEGVLAQFLLVRERSSPDSDPAIQRWLGTHSGSSGSVPRLRLLETKRETLAELCKAGALYQTKVYISLRLAPQTKSKPAAATGPFSLIAFLRRARTSQPASARVADELNDLCQIVRTSLESQGFETGDVSGKERLDLLYRYLNPERSRVLPTRIDANEAIPQLAERLSLTDFMEGRDGIRLGRVPFRIATLKSLPDASIPCLANEIATCTSPFLLVLTVLMLPQTSERERLSRKQRLAQGMASGNRVRNLVAETQLQEIEETLSSMISSGEKLVASSFHLVVWGDEDTEPAKFASLLGRAESLGAGCQWFEETVGAFPVFFGTLPFAPAFMPRPKRMLTSTLSDFLPLFGMPAGHEQAEVLFESPFASALGFSLFEKSPSANAILIGSTGSGKSTLACGLIMGMTAGSSAECPSSFVIDVGNSFKRTILYLGGASLDLSPEKGTRLNPFDLPPGVRTPDPEKVKFLMAFFDEVLGDQGNLSKLERALIETEILRFYELEGPKTLSRFREYLENVPARELQRLSQLLALWCNPHPYGLLFDGETNVDLKAPHLHFELKGCQRYPDLLRVAMLVVMDLIWREVRSRFPGRSLIVIDEAHTVIRPSGDGRSNAAARWVDDLFRQMRKFASSAIAISQTAKDLKNDEIGDGILANAPNRFVLRQRGDERTLREDLKLNEEELKAVFALAQVRGAYSEFFLHSESIKSVLIYRPTPIELWLSTTHPPDLGILERERSQHPEWSLAELIDHLAAAYPGGAELAETVVVS